MAVRRMMAVILFSLLTLLVQQVIAQNVIEFESAAVTVVENAVQVEIGVRLATVGQADIVTGNLAVPIMARISTSDITAVAGGTGQGDYDSLSGVMVMFTVGTAPNSVQRQNFVTINDDDVFEPDETFRVTFEAVDTSQGDSPNFVVGSISETIITILDEDDLVTVRFAAPSSVVVPEGGGPATLCTEIATGTLSAGATASITVTTFDGTAQQSADYIAQSVNVVFNAGNMDNMLCVNIPIIDDLLCEGIETFGASLTAGQNTGLATPAVATVTITDNDVATVTLNAVDPMMFSGSLQECANEGFWFRIELAGAVTKGPNQQCVISVMTQDGSAVAGSDYSALTGTCTISAVNTFCSFHIDVLDDFTAEMDETFNIILTSLNSQCDVDDNTITITIVDDEDCDDDVCGEFEMCEELMCPNNFTCIMGPNGGDDPHFAVTLSSGKTLCYTVQGEHGFAFNLISNEKVYMNAMFVPDALREEVTWLGTIGVVINKNDFKKSNMTKLRFEAIKNIIHIDDQVVLEARNIEKITLENGKLIISEAPPTEGYKTPFVRIDLKDVELSFSIKFMTEHLDMYWHSTGQIIADSHGLIGQFFHPDVALDEVRKMLILPGKEPVPVQRKPLWAYMEREIGDSTNFCWVAMNPGYQGEGLIDGSYFDYLVDDVLSTEFKFKKL